MNHRQLSDSIREYLLEGPSSPDFGNDKSGQTQEDLISYINQQCEIFISEIRLHDIKTKELVSKLKSKQDHVNKIQRIFNNFDFLSKLRRYLDQQNKVQLLETANLLSKLEHAASKEKLKDIPDIVIEIIATAPKYIPVTSIIKAKLLELVTNLRKQQLQNFHTKFENHLGSENVTIGSSANSKMGQQSLHSWVLFLSDARDWLLSFVCVSLLPIILTESKNSLIDKYQDTIDEALTPLWGRFHSHLSLAREQIALCSNVPFTSTDETSTNIRTAASEQMLWTFHYSRNYLELLLNLAHEITVSGQLQRICNISYHEVTRKYIVEKSVRFLRAHAADIIVKVSTVFTSDRIVANLFVENILEMDSYLNSLQPNQPINICHVLYDAKSFFQHWHFLEKEQFREVISTQLSFSIKKLFSFDLNGEELYIANGWTPIDTNNYDSRPSDNGECRTNNISISQQSSIISTRCYKCIYHCMSYFILATQRYQYLPLVAQDIFAATVVEPLLCLCVGLFLYWVKANPFLYAVSHKNHYYLSEFITKDIINQYNNFNRYPSEITDYIQSVQYFQKSIHFSSYSDLFVGNIKRYEEVWKQVHEWIPKRTLFSHEVAKGGEYTPLNLGTNVFKLANEYCEANYLKQSSSSSHPVSLYWQNNKSKSKQNNLTKCDDKESGDGSGVLASCVDTARAQVLTLAHVLESQFNKHVAKFK